MQSYVVAYLWDDRGEDLAADGEAGDPQQRLAGALSLDVQTRRVHPVADTDQPHDCMTSTGRLAEGRRRSLPSDVGAGFRSPERSDSQAAWSVHEPPGW